MAAEEKKQASEPKKEAAPAAGKKKPPIKVIGIVAGIMAVEAAGVYVLVGMSSPKSAAAVEVHDAEQAEAQKSVEIELIDDKFQNMQTGSVWMWDMQIVLKTTKKNEAHVNEELEKRSAEIKEGIAQIVRRAQHSHLKEPDLVTLSRQLTAYADKVFGHDSHGDSRVEKIIIPKCRGVDIER